MFSRRAIFSQPAQDQRKRNQLEVVLLAARQNRGRDLVILRGRHDKNHVRRRFFESLQQGVEGLFREHVHFIDDEDLVPVAGRFVADFVPQFPDLIDAPVGSRIDLQHVHAVSRSNLLAGHALPAGLARITLVAIQRLGQDPGCRRLTAASGTGKQESVSDTPPLEGVQQGAGNVILPD